MENTSLVRLLRQLTPKQMHRLDKFLQSPYFTQSVLLYRLFKYLRNCYPEMVGSEMKEENIFKALFPDDPFDKKRLGKKRSDLKKQVELFLKIEAFQEDAAAQRIQFAKATGKFEDDHFFKNHFNQCKRKIESSTSKGQMEYLEYYLLWLAWYRHPKTQKYKIRNNPVSKMIESLDGFHQCSKLALSAEVLNRQQFLKDETLIGFLEGLLAEINRQETYRDNPVFDLYCQIVEMLQNREPDVWEKIETVFRKKHHELPEIEKRAIYFMITNSVTRIYHEKDPTQIHRLFSLYCFGLDEGILLTDGRLPASTFINISNTAVLAKEYDMASDFMIQYKKVLLPDIGKDIHALCQAFLFFHQKDYLKAYDILPHNILSNYRFVLLEKSLAVRCLYEKAKEDDAAEEMLEDAIKAFELFIARGKVLSKKERKRYLNFVYMMNKIMRLRMKRFAKVKEKQRLLGQLSKETNIFSKEWLEEKIVELK